MKAERIYNYKFENGTITVSKGVHTKFDWHVDVELNPIQKEGYLEKRYILLDMKKFLTKKSAIYTTTELLKKYNLISA